jgi:hypothetical protein
MIMVVSLLFGVFIGWLSLLCVTIAFSRYRNKLSKALRIDPFGSSYIYFWQSVKDPLSVKIGRTNNLIRRMDTFQTAQAEPIRLLCAIEVKDNRYSEKWLHDCFENSRVRRDGEWFYLTPKLAILMWAIRDSELTERVRRHINETGS